MNIDLYFKKIKEICGHNINSGCMHISNVITTSKLKLLTDCQMAYCPFVKIIDDILSNK